MSIINGSLNHTISGRKRKKKYTTKVKKKEVPFTPLGTLVYKNYRETPIYPSASGTYNCSKPKAKFKLEVSSQYTVAVAYNKGAYQVIGKNNLKDIGK